jgi:hypothetical protein
MGASGAGVYWRRLIALMIAGTFDSNSLGRALSKNPATSQILSGAHGTRIQSFRSWRLPLADLPSNAFLDWQSAPDMIAAFVSGLLMTLSGRDRIVRLKSAREPKRKTRLFGSRRQSPVLS